MTPSHFEQWLEIPPAARRRTLVMGVLNVTPDSFSDGGQFASTDRAVAHALEMAAAGADLIDVGGESTRPGSQPVPADEQIARINPVLTALRDLHLPVTFSIDTTRAAVAEAALDLGVSIVNDISAGRDDGEMLPLAARRGAPIVLMHVQGTPATMQLDPRYDDVTRVVGDFLRDRAAAARTAGVAGHRILIDPGIGFGKTIEHNLELLRRLEELAVPGPPVVVGASRKGFIGRVIGESDPARRAFGGAAAAAWAVMHGAAIVRTHDVRETAQVTRMIEAIKTGVVLSLPSKAS